MTTQPYDTVAYPGFALAQAHPNRLATLATLFGMIPADVSRCRVLELGCGDGLNLISVALGLTEAECLGVDLSGAGIVKGQNIVRELGLKNIDLRQLDIMDIGPDLGKFDYIVAHGIYSWVPQQVRDKLLWVCQHSLSENGVAFVSYNTYPGGHLRDMIRGMMRYHVSEFSDPAQRVSQARALVSFLAQSSTEHNAYRQLIKMEMDRIDEARDSSLFHDDLGEYNEPVYFCQFVDHAAHYGLKYLCEAHLFEIQTGIFPPEVVQTLQQISDSTIAQEQYLDFLKGRRFRQTLLCHKDQRLDSTPSPEKIRAFSVASPVQSETIDRQIASTQTVAFLGPSNSSVKTDNPLIKAAMSVLGGAWPKALPFPDLLAKARAVCGRNSSEHVADVEVDAQVLGDMLLRAYAGGIVELHIYPPQFVLEANEKPIASPLARLQSRMGVGVVTLRHNNIAVEEALGRYLLQLLDGSRDRNDLLNELLTAVESGLIKLEWADQATSEPIDIRKLLAVEMEQYLAKAARLALLVA
jgi:methyltransferase-like protein/cyclopropane fatty-acyl-phospholipid synthase-like methyltransferase